MDTLQDDLDALRRAQPSWRADTLGVKGAPVEFHKQQANVNWPSSTISHRAGGVNTGEASPGSPEAPISVPAT